MEDHEAAEWQEWDAFIASHLRYEDTSENFALLAEFFAEHGLDFNRDALHLAFMTLGNKLELTPLATPLAAPIIEQPESKTPIPEPIPEPRRAPIAWRNGKVIELTNARPL